jgi:apolipoprotein N-acyltransferase
MICLSPWVLFGARRDALAETSADARVSIAAVQGSIDDPEWASAMSDAADSGAPLIVTAEGAGAGAPFAALGSVHVLLGTQTGCGKLDGRRCVQNSVVHYDTDGRMKGQYDKQLLVPLYERDFAFWRAQEASIMKPGEGPGIFEVEGIRVGVAICYEIVDSALVSRLSEAGATLIVHPTSDAWQSGRTAIAQHLAVARVRAAETGLPILRVSNREGTVLVRPDGSVTPLVRPDAAAVALAMVDRTPVHTYFGSNRKFVVASQAATAILLVLGALLRRAALRREA